MRTRINISIIIIIAALAAFYMQSFKVHPEFTSIDNPEMPPKLSDYAIFKGKASDMIPTDDYALYELATGLFTDYAEKQRLVKIPKGTKINAVGDGLPDFPDGTILVKTFYYLNDKKDASKGKRIMETRVMSRMSSKWTAGTYKWNNEQTEGFLITKGFDMPVNFIDKNGDNKQISYHIPGTKDCTKCHNSNSDFIPIGPKMRNLNRDVQRNNIEINQLDHLKAKGILESHASSDYAKLPNWQDTSVSVEKRARAYMDVNCAHCHSDGGYHFFTNLKLGYEIPLEKTKLAEKADKADKYMSKKKMPYIGTTVIDEEGLSLVKEYLNTLK